MLGALMAAFPNGPSIVLKDSVLAAATPSPTPSVVSADSASALPSWLLVSLLLIVGLVIVAAFSLTAYSLSAPRSTLKNIIGKRASQGTASEKVVNSQLVKTLATAARSGKRTTRTTLAIVGFSLLGVVIVAIFGLSGQGVRDLRSQVIAAVTTLVATIAGFYFGAETARNQGAQGGSASTAPTLKPDPKNPSFTIDKPGSYTPVVTGTPAPTISVSPEPLPPGLQLDPTSGVISGTPTGTAATYDITLIAHNGISPDATLPIKLVIGKAG